MAKCNLNIEERAAVMASNVWGFYSTDEYDRLRQLFPQYLFIRKDDEGTEWCCTSCRMHGFEFKRGNRQLYKGKHNDVARCPHCGEGMVLKNLGRIRSGAGLHESLAVNFINIDEEGALFIESGIAFWDWDFDWQMEESFTAKKRYYIAPGKVQCWKRNFDWSPWLSSFKPIPWVSAKSILEPFERDWMHGTDGFSIFIGLEKIEHSALKYCAIEQYFEDYHSIQDLHYEKQPLRLVQKYLAEYAMRPVIEMAVKMGHADIVGELVRDGKANAKDVNWKAKNPAAFCRLTKAEYRELHECMDLQRLRLYHRLKKSGMIYSTGEALTIWQNIGSGNYVDKIERICCELHIDLTRVARYLGKETRTASTWLDYIDMAKKLGYDLTEETVVFPKKLSERHDQAAAIIKSEATEKQMQLYKKQKEMLEKKYSFAMDGLRIIVPENAGQIVEEGQTLHHCVAGYADRHIAGKTVILFLRRERKPNTSFLTIELDTDGNMRQIHGYKNEHYPFAVSPREKYVDWLNAWQKWYRSGSLRDTAGNPIIKKENIA